MKIRIQQILILSYLAICLSGEKLGIEEKDKYFINTKCNMMYSKLALLIISEIKNYYSNFIDSSNHNCKFNIIDDNNNIKNLQKLTKQIYFNEDKFKNMFINDLLIDRNPGTYKCFKCKKKFKKKVFLLKHIHLFHEQNNGDICLADYCNILNCDRYISYFSSKEFVFLDESEYSPNNFLLHDRFPNKMFIFDDNKKYSSLINVNTKLVCFSLLKSCLNENIEFSVKQNLIKDFYHRFCRNININYDYNNNENNKTKEENVEKSSFVNIESIFMIILKQIFKIILIFFIFIYLLVIWLSRK